MIAKRVPAQLGRVRALICGALALGAVAVVLPVAPAAAADLADTVAAMAPGTTLRLPAGVFEVSAPLQLPAGATLTGAGPATILRISRANWDNFKFGFAIAPRESATGVTVTNLTVDGNRTNHGGGGANPAANVGGGVKLGTGWTVSAVRFTNINYYPVWIRGVRGVKVTGCTFDADGGSSAGKDNIGGGRSAGVTISGNRFAASITGNAVDLVGVADVTITDNVLTGSPAREHSLYLEGVTGARVTGNRISRGSITVTNDANYEGVEQAVNPRKVTISGNTVTDAPASAITITYGTADGGMTRGGGNRISGNTVDSPGLTGVAIVHCVPDATGKPDRITDNVVTNAFDRGASQWGTGCGTVASSGIAVTAGSGTVITGNEVSDTASRPGIQYAVYLGATRARAELRDPQVSGNSGPQSVEVTGWAQ